MLRYNSSSTRQYRESYIKHNAVTRSNVRHNLLHPTIQFTNVAHKFPMWSLKVFSEIFVNRLILRLRCFVLLWRNILNFVFRRGRAKVPMPPVGNVAAHVGLTGDKGEKVAVDGAPTTTRVEGGVIQASLAFDSGEKACTW